MFFLDSNQDSCDVYCVRKDVWDLIYNCFSNVVVVLDL